MFAITDYGIVPNAPYDQTEQIQAVLDLCRESGGTVCSGSPLSSIPHRRKLP